MNQSKQCVKKSPPVSGGSILSKIVAKFLSGALVGVLWAASTSNARANESTWVTQDRLTELVDQARLPTDATVEVNFLKADQRIDSKQCPNALFSNPNGNKMWGRTFVHVQCIGANTSPFYLGVDVKVWSPVLVIKNTIQSGQTIHASDVEFRVMDLAQQNQGWMDNLAQLNNKVATKKLWPGELLRHDYLRGHALIKRGEAVKVRMQGTGFAIAGVAVAMSEAELDEVVRIKTSQGKILQGVARATQLVEVNL